MTVAILDINDSNLQLWQANTQVQSPGYALLEGGNYRFGAALLEQAGEVVVPGLHPLFPARDDGLVDLVQPVVPDQVGQLGRGVLRRDARQLGAHQVDRLGRGLDRVLGLGDRAGPI